MLHPIPSEAISTPQLIYSCASLSCILTSGFVPDADNGECFITDIIDYGTCLSHTVFASYSHVGCHYNIIYCDPCVLATR